MNTQLVKIGKVLRPSIVPFARPQSNSEFLRGCMRVKFMEVDVSRLIGVRSTHHLWASYVVRIPNIDISSGLVVIPLGERTLIGLEKAIEPTSAATVQYMHHPDAGK